MLLRIQFVLALIVLLMNFSGDMNAQTKTNENQNLSTKQKSIVAISALTAQGDLKKLKKALVGGLEADLTVNEIKEVLVHLYAYCGFPRSLQGLHTFIAVLEERKKQGIKDVVGKEATPVSSNESKYERGRKNLEILTGQIESRTKTGYAAFSPEIEIFLKEHLFADIFERDVLNFTDREIVTISALISLGGVEPQLQGHFNIGMNVGLSESGLNQILSIIETNVGKKEADAGREVLNKVLKKSTNMEKMENKNESAIFPKGEKAPAQNFTGTVWLQMLVPQNENINYSIGSVTFEPGARSNWHTHPAGQILLITEGKGLYQERGKPVKPLNKGDVIICDPDIEHWHGASRENQMTHIAVTNSKDNVGVVWLKPVTDAEYNSEVK
jgi:4-carboxymuconolactone decarboxylase